MLSEMERLVLAQPGAHPLKSKALESKLRELGRAVRRMDSAAVEPLALYLGDKTRPLKARVYAATFLGLRGDPAAYPRLRARAADPEEDASLRSIALHSIGSLRLPKEAVRLALDEAAADPKAPESLLRESLAQLSLFGTDEVQAVALAARRAGPAPRGGLAEADARHALRALRLSRRSAATPALFDLLRFFRRGSPLTLEVLDSLEARGLEPALREEDLYSLTATLSDPGPAAARVARLLAQAADPRSLKPLLQALDSRDPEVVVESAEALVRLGVEEAREPLAKAAEGLIEDNRFAPRPGGPDMAALAVRLAKAAAQMQDKPAERFKTSALAPARRPYPPVEDSSQAPSPRALSPRAPPRGASELGGQPQPTVVPPLPAPAARPVAQPRAAPAMPMGYPDARAVRRLLKDLRSKNLETAAAAAEELARLKLPEAREPLLALADGMVDDERFAPREGGPDVVALAGRIQRAADAFRR